MPRFFFHYRENGVIHSDEAGIEYPSTEEAFLAAMEAIRGMWSELLVKRQDPLNCAFEIRDSGGALLFMVPFREVLEACRRDIGPGDSLRQNVEKAHETHAFAKRVRQELHDEMVETRRGLRESAGLLATPSDTGA